MKIIWIQNGSAVIEALTAIIILSAFIVGLVRKQTLWFLLLIFVFLMEKMSWGLPLTEKKYLFTLQEIEIDSFHGFISVLYSFSSPLFWSLFTAGVILSYHFRKKWTHWPQFYKGSVLLLVMAQFLNLFNGQSMPLTLIEEGIELTVAVVFLIIAAFDRTMLTHEGNWRPLFRHLGVPLFMKFLSIGLETVAILIFGFIIDERAHDLIKLLPFEEYWSGTKFKVIMFLSAGSASISFNYLSEILRYRGARLMAQELRTGLLDHMAFANLRRWQQSGRLGNLTWLTTMGAEHLNKGITALFFLTHQSFLIAVSIALLVTISPPLAAITGTAICGIMILRAYFKRTISKAAEKVITTEVESQRLSEHVVEGALVPVRTPLALPLLDALRSLLRERDRAHITHACIKTSFGFAYEIATLLAVAGTILLYFDDKKGIATTIIGMGLLLRVGPKIVDVQKYIGDYATSQATWNRLLEELRQLKKNILPLSSQGTEWFLSGQKAGERLLYPATQLSWMEGKKILLTGPNGSGKTTLALELCATLDPENVIYVGHDPLIFEGTLTDNVWLERNSERPMAFPLLETLLERFGNQSKTAQEWSKILSRGEKTLIAFSRALVKKTRLLVLDEAMESLSPEMRSLVNQSILEMEGSVLIISHQPDNHPFVSERLHLKEGHLQRITQRQAV